MSKIYFKVAPYALFDVLKAFENDSDIHRRIDYTVTKEDGELVVIANENYKQVVHKESLTNTNGELLDEETYNIEELLKGNE